MCAASRLICGSWSRASQQREGGVMVRLVLGQIWRTRIPILSFHLVPMFDHDHEEAASMIVGVYMLQEILQVVAAEPSL